MEQPRFVISADHGSNSVRYIVANAENGEKVIP